MKQSNLNLQANTGELKEGKFKEYRKNGKHKIKPMIFLILISDSSRYPCFNSSEQLPSEKTPRRTVGTHPRSPEVPNIYHRMKDSLPTLAVTFIYRLPSSIHRQSASIARMRNLILKRQSSEDSSVTSFLRLKSSSFTVSHLRGSCMEQYVLSKESKSWHGETLTWNPCLNTKSQSRCWNDASGWEHLLTENQR
jgi:hypothetical protein